MTTLAQIAESFGVKPDQMASMVGMEDVGVNTPLTTQQAEFAIEAADHNPFSGPIQIGRHSRRR